MTPNWKKFWKLFWISEENRRTRKLKPSFGQGLVTLYVTNNWRLLFRRFSNWFNVRDSTFTTLGSITVFVLSRRWICHWQQRIFLAEIRKIYRDLFYMWKSTSKPSILCGRLHISMIRSFLNLVGFSFLSTRIQYSWVAIQHSSNALRAHSSRQYYRC